MKNTLLWNENLNVFFIYLLTVIVAYTFYFAFIFKIQHYSAILKPQLDFLRCIFIKLYFLYKDRKSMILDVTNV